MTYDFASRLPAAPYGMIFGESSPTFSSYVVVDSEYDLIFTTVNHGRDIEAHPGDVPRLNTQSFNVACVVSEIPNLLATLTQLASCAPEDLVTCQAAANVILGRLDARLADVPDPT